MAKPVLLLPEPDGFSADARLLLSQHFAVVAGPFTRAALLEAAADAMAVMVRLGHRLDEEFFGRATKLRFVASPTTGLNHIDEDAARRRGVSIVSLRGERAFLDNVYATAEHTFALLLALLRRIPSAHRSVCAGEWNRDLFRGGELNGRTIGIVGCGRLGGKVAGYARAFGMTVLGCDSVAKTPDWIAKVEIEDLCARADVISLHATAISENSDMFSEREFGLMRRGAIFINTARGELVDEDALLAALRSGQLGGAALDVLKCENSDADQALASGSALKDYARRHDNLILTPHIGGATFDSMRKTEMFIAERLLAAVSGVATGSQA
jgi:D-3-phosphoglycerate dehydrogenase